MKGGIKSRKEKKKEVRIIICHFLVFWQLRIFCADEKTQGRTPREEKREPKILTLSIWSSLRRCQSASIAALYSTYTTGVKKKKVGNKNISYEIDNEFSHLYVGGVAAIFLVGAPFSFLNFLTFGRVLRPRRIFSNQKWILILWLVVSFLNVG